MDLKMCYLIFLDKEVVKQIVIFTFLLPKVFTLSNVVGSYAHIIDLIGYRFFFLTYLFFAIFTFQSFLNFAFALFLLQNKRYCTLYLKNFHAPF